MAKRKTNLRKKSKCRTKKSGGTLELGQPVEVSPESGQPVEVSPESGQSGGKLWIGVAAIIAFLFFSLMYIFGNDIYSLFTSTPKPKPDDDDKK